MSAIPEPAATPDASAPAVAMLPADEKSPTTSMSPAVSISPAAPRLEFFALVFLSLLSGVAALAYQVSWSRQIGGLIGHTVQAATIVLSAFFIGMALGYVGGGWLAARIRRPLSAYAAVEGLLAISAAAAPFAIAWIGELDVLLSIGGIDGPLRLTLQSASLGLVLLPATSAMGATLPLLAAVVETRFAARQACRATTILYAWNTAGALTGVLVATFYLLATAGVAATGLIAAGGSLCVAGGAAALAWHAERSSARRNSIPSGETIHCALVEAPPVEASPQCLPSVHRAHQAARRWWLAAIASGAGLLALEVLFTGMFALVLHNSSYTFGLVVAVFLASLSIGSWWAARLERSYPPERIAAWAALAGSLVLPIGVLGFVLVSRLEYVSLGSGFAGYLTSVGLLVTSIVAPVVIPLALILPAAWQGLSREAMAERFGSREGSVDEEGGAVIDRPDSVNDASRPNSGEFGYEDGRAEISGIIGRATAANALASAAGAAITSFVLLPLLGLWMSLAVVSILYLALALRLAAELDRGPIWLAAPLVLCVQLLAAVAPQSLTGVAPNEVLLARWNSAYGWIDVVADRGTNNRRLRQNIHYGLGSSSSVESHRRQARLPLVVHGQPRDILFLGLATGNTASEVVVQNQIERCDIVELIPEVVAAAPLFAETNLELLADPRVRVIVDDARHVLRTRPHTYDVIVADLFVPWESRTGYLYTVDFYERVRQRLRPRGIFCQWIALWQVGPSELELIADSFAHVFPHTTLWFGRKHPERTTLCLIGSERVITLDRASLDALLLDLNRRAADPILVDAAALERLYIGDWPRREAATLNTDEQPRLEFSAPLTHADRAMLKFARLRDYVREIFDRLERKSVRFDSP